MGHPFAVEPRLAEALHARLRVLLDDLSKTAAEHGDCPGMLPALTTVLGAIRELDGAVTPAADTELPADEDLGWPSPAVAGTCGIPIQLELESARTLVKLFTGRSRDLNRLLGQIQLHMPNRRAPRELTLSFAHVMGYLYTEICRPLHRQHVELEPIALGEATDG